MHILTDCYGCCSINENKSVSLQGDLQFIVIAWSFYFRNRVTFIGIIHYLVWDKSRVESRAACLHFGLTRETLWEAFFPFGGCLITINVKWVFIFTGREIMTGPNSIVTPTLINSHRASSMAPFFHCEIPASWCMNGEKKKEKKTHK